ncbi:MAG TPA: GNAT family N-acetyltransferase [Gemmatimonadales bacterium]|nr:GNAT family N-acetyltransferase [Gemmatimonadales bacterium]
MTTSRSGILKTPRLALRELDDGNDADADFILGLLNEPSFLEFIGDRGVRNTDDARAYIRNGPLASYAAHGFGLWLVTRTSDAAPIGICGLLRRETLPDPDLGFAYRPAYWRQGYAEEAGRAVVAHGRTAFGLTRILAVTVPGNRGSIRVLEKIGFQFERLIPWPGDASEIQLHAWDSG